MLTIRMSFDGFPNEILLVIACFLKIRDKDALMRTCRRMRSLLLPDLVQKHVQTHWKNHSPCIINYLYNYTSHQLLIVLDRNLSQATHGNAMTNIRATSHSWGQHGYFILLVNSRRWQEFVCELPRPFRYPIYSLKQMQDQVRQAFLDGYRWMTRPLFTFHYSIWQGIHFNRPTFPDKKPRCSVQNPNKRRPLFPRQFKRTPNKWV